MFSSMFAKIRCWANFDWQLWHNTVLLVQNISYLFHKQWKIVYRKINWKNLLLTATFLIWLTILLWASIKMHKSTIYWLFPKITISGTPYLNTQAMCTQPKEVLFASHFITIRCMQFSDNTETMQCMQLSDNT